MQNAIELNVILQGFEAHSSELLPILHAVQETYRYIPSEHIPEIAQYLGLSSAEVYGVIQFYDHFHDTPPAEHIVHICRAEACQANGSLALIHHAEQILACSLGQKSADHLYELRAAYCLGLCANGPVVLVDDRLVAGVQLAQLGALLQQQKP